MSDIEGSGTAADIMADAASWPGVRIADAATSCRCIHGGGAVPGALVGFADLMGPVLDDFVDESGTEIWATLTDILAAASSAVIEHCAHNPLVRTAIPLSLEHHP